MPQWREAQVIGRLGLTVSFESLFGGNPPAAPENDFETISGIGPYFARRLALMEGVVEAEVPVVRNREELDAWAGRAPRLMLRRVLLQVFTGDGLKGRPTKVNCRALHALVDSLRTLHPLAKRAIKADGICDTDK